MILNLKKLRTGNSAVFGQAYHDPDPDTTDSLWVLQVQAGSHPQGPSPLPVCTAEEGQNLTH